jgi:hypothetical protein
LGSKELYEEGKRGEKEPLSAVPDRPHIAAPQDYAQDEARLKELYDAHKPCGEGCAH